jgi:hypothetical protein
VSHRAGHALAAGAAILVLAACGTQSARSGSLRPIEPAAPPSPPQAGISVTGCDTNSQPVTSAADLTQALAAAVPGTMLLLAPGTYSGHFVAKTSGTSSEPISLCGTRDSVLDGGSTKLGYTLYLNGASWWRLIGFTVKGGQKGIVTDHVDHDLISGLYVHDIGDEGIHLRSFSTDNIVEGVTVRNTGLATVKFGEGIYVGSANKNWCKYTSCQPDASDRNVIRGNDIASTTAENIDIKEGTTAGVITGNKLSGEGMVASAATAWVNVKGNGWTVSENTGLRSLKDGFQVHRVYAGWGKGNIFRLNKAMVDGPGYGFYIQSASLLTILACDNTAVGAALGLSNAHCTGA